jgi:XRE family transcriptional regulator, aerobic/anaerobic benzoate catabolism transcriptional regulator
MPPAKSRTIIHAGAAAEAEVERHSADVLEPPPAIAAEQQSRPRKRLTSASTMQYSSRPEATCPDMNRTTTAASTQRVTPPVSAPGHQGEDAAFLIAMGRRVRDAREQRGMARKVLAQSAGVSERYLAQLEAGEGNASVLLLRHVARALGLALTELLETREHPVEQRLIRRFLEQLPEHRLEDIVFRLMRDFGREEATRRKRIALVGLRGAGKTTLGRALAAELAVPFVELNREIEQEAGIRQSEVFSLYGQAGYRRIERRCLERTIEAHPEMVLTVGGGIVSEPDTYNLLLVNCYTVWVKASPTEHMARVVAQGDLRPMQGNAEAMGDLTRILDAREPMYRRTDITLDTTGEQPEQSLGKLRQAVQA